MGLATSCAHREQRRHILLTSIELAVNSADYLRAAVRRFFWATKPKPSLERGQRIIPFPLNHFSIKSMPDLYTLF